MKLRAWTTWGGFALVAASAGCGDDGETIGSGGAGGAGPTSTSSSSTSTPSSNASSSSSNASSSSSDASSSSGTLEECSSDEPTPITFVIRNDTDTRIWFQGSGFGQTLLAAIAVDGNAVSPCPCDDLSACSSMQASVSTDVGYLDPGESFEEVWTGLFYAPDPVCDEQLSCEPGATPPAGQLVGTVTGYLGAGQCDEACDCSLADGNVCNFGEGAGTPTEPVDASAVFAFPDETTVDVVFQL